MALVTSTAPDLLAVTDQTNLFLHLVALPPAAALIGSVKLDHPPVGLVAAPGGHWAYVLERDTDSFVQSDQPGCAGAASRRNARRGVKDRRRQPADRHDRIGQASLHSLRR